VVYRIAPFSMTLNNS